jgi:ketosteroid isomerase-like protein
MGGDTRAIGKEDDMALDNEQIVRQAYKIAEDMDTAAWVAAFTEDGTFTDESIGVTWKGPAELPVQVEKYHRAFPDIHRELYQVYVSGDLTDGKIKRFDCYPEGSIILTQLGVIGSLSAALAH